jgi:predicted ATPase/DNA-binding CsgD family transcriptional regulator
MGSTMGAPNSGTTEFPPHTARNSLRSPEWVVPAPLLPLLGREIEIHEVTRLMDDESVRLLTLTGPGGVGKTSLAREIAVRMQVDFAHGACFVSCASVSDPEFLTMAIANSLGLSLLTNRPIGDMVIDVLSDRHALLVLDNLEHLLDGAADLILRLLEQCPRLRVLATSRAALHIAGEQRYVVGPLALDEQRTPAPESPDDASPAVTLFRDRAQAADPGFELTSENANDVIRICNLLDGLPLAIELAAVQVRLMPPNQLYDHLQDGLIDLHTDRRDVPARHQTMRAAISWGYQRLDADPQRLIRWLSVFVGGFSVNAVRAVADSAGLDNPDRELLHLVDHSFVRQSGSGAEEHRFAILEVVREFGVQELAVHEEYDSAMEAHALWVLQQAREAEVQLYGEQQISWLIRLDQEQANVRRAVTWFEANGRIEEAFDLTGSLWFYRWLRSHYGEARDQLEGLLADPRGQDSTISRGKALHAIGIIANHQGDLRRSTAALNEAIEIFESHDEQRWLSLALLRIGVTHVYAGRIADAEAAAEASLRIARSIDDPWLIQAAEGNVGVRALDRGDIDSARQHYEESIRAARDAGDRLFLGVDLVRIGKLDQHAGDLDAADLRYREGARLIEQLGSKRDLPVAYAAIADIARLRGKLDEARSRFQQAYQITRELDDHRWAPAALEGLARVAGARGDYREAVTWLREEMRVYERAGDRLNAILCLDLFADMALGLGDAEHAAWCVGAVDGALQREDRPRREDAPGEHAARVDSIAHVLGASHYRQHHNSGRLLDSAAVLAEAAAWMPPASPPDTSVEPGPSLPVGAETLSKRELEVLILMAEGLTNQEIADSLFVSFRTVTTHVTGILGKLGLTSRTAAVAYAIRNGLA